MNYTIPADGLISINTPNYPNNYKNNEFCRWFIRGADNVQAGRRKRAARGVSITIKDFVTEEYYDVMKIGLGDNISDKNSVVMEASGPFAPPDLQMDGSVFWITFNADPDKTERGFSIYLEDMGYTRE